MKVQLRFFALARELAETGDAILEVPDGATVADVRLAISRRWPALTALSSQVMIAVNSQYASDSTKVAADAEIAFIPPVSGG
jgi:molybdopterin converting factor subunit 1